MSGANRKAKLSTYEVVLKREVEFTATIHVQARNREEAEAMAIAAADAPKANLWREGDVTNEAAAVKLVRNA